MSTTIAAAHEESTTVIDRPSTLLLRLDGTIVWVEGAPGLHDWTGKPFAMLVGEMRPHQVFAAIGQCLVTNTLARCELQGTDGSHRLTFKRVDEMIVCRWRPLPAARLTPRERDVLDRICAGMTASEMAADLGLSLSTIESHRASLLRRTDSDGNVAVAMWAMRYGLFDPNV